MTYAHVKWRTAAALCLLTTACLGDARAQAVSTAYGVWRGTVGAEEVMVNLKPATCGSSYYYIRHLWGIPLRELVSGAGSWREGVNSEGGPTWTITMVTATVLSGAWADAKGQGSVPLHLERVAAGPETSDDCYEPRYQSADAVFNAPRIAAKAPKSSAATFEGRHYQLLTVPQTGIKALQLPNEPHPAPRLNLFLRQWLQSEVATYYDCQLNSAKANRENGDESKFEYTSQYAPVFWNTHLLVVRLIYSNFCGGPYPDGGIDSHLVWDLDADQALNPIDWVRGIRVEASGEWVLTPKLKALVWPYSKAAGGAGVSNVDDGTECVEAVLGYDLFPSSKGMVFRPKMPHVRRECEDEVLVSWRKFRPFLTSAGTQLVREKILGGVVP